MAGFARCDACHPYNADTKKSGPHYQMKCADCHKVSGFQQDAHSSTIPECSGCHAGIGTGKQHTKPRYFPESEYL